MQIIRNLEKENIKILIEQLDSILQKTSITKLEIVLVGGALLALKGLRKSTVDIDFLYKQQIETAQRDELMFCVQEVSKANGIPEDWLNNDIENLPIYLEGMQKELLWKLERIVVYVASDIDLLALKLIASIERSSVVDSFDVATLWKEVSMSNNKKDVLKRVRAFKLEQYFDYDLAEEILAEVGTTGSYLFIDS